MEITRTLGGVMGNIQMLVNLIARNRELAAEVVTDLESMNDDFEILTRVRLERKDGQLLKQLAPGMQLQLQDLAYDIDDFIQDLLVPGPWGSFVLIAIGADSRPILLQRLKAFRERIKNLKDELPKSYESIPSRALAAGPSSSSSSAGSPIPYAPEVELVGMEGPKKEIVELLSAGADSHGGRISVISIVGCGGSGKTALARALYEDHAAAKDFDYKAWVVASDPNSTDIVKKIREAVVSVSALETTSQAPQDFQKDKRYLVFVDDVLRETPWEDIKKVLCENDKGSKIILTTRVPSFARDNSSGSYEYTMQGLDKEKACELFCRKFWRKHAYSDEDKHRLGKDGIDVVLDKCDGLPIALISAAECLRRRGLNPKPVNFDQVCEELRDLLACSDSAFEEFQEQNGIVNTFAEMRRGHVEPYENQLNNGEKECLLYLSIFPFGHQINSNSLIRRLIAEGIIPRDPNTMKAPKSVVGVVTDCVRKLMDRRMIEPVPIRNYSNVAKRCRVHSIMLQFTIKKAASRNFVSQIHDNQPLRSTTGKVRRLTVQSSREVGSTGLPEGMGLSVLRSLAIFDSGILNLEKCRLVRVLDLEGCSLLTRKDLDNICGLLFLKYLRLRNSRIPEFPRNVKRLMSLETLDTRDTPDKVVIKLPVEVLMLPRFAYLFGKYELTNVQSNNTKELTMFFSEKKSQLHTLGGIVIHETKVLDIVLLIVQLATKLKKVKVWYRDTPSSRGHVTTSTPAVGVTPELPSVGSSVDSRSNAQDPNPQISTPLADGTLDPFPGATIYGHKWNTPLKPKWKWFPTRLFKRHKLSAGPLDARIHGPSADYNTNEQDPDPTTSTPVDGTPGLPSAGPSVDSSSNAQDPTPTISTPVAEGTLKPIPGASGHALSTQKWNTLPKPKRKWFPTRLFRRQNLSQGPSKAKRHGPAPDSTSDTHDPSPATSTPLATDTPGLSCAEQLSYYISNEQDPAPTTSTPLDGGTPGLPSAGPSIDSSNNAQDPTSAIPTPVAKGIPEPIPGATGPALSTHKWNTHLKPKRKWFPTRLFRRQKLSMGPSKAIRRVMSRGPLADYKSNAQGPTLTTSTLVNSGTPGLPSIGSLVDSSGNAQDPTPTTSALVDGGSPGLPSAGPSADSSNNAQDLSPATSTPVAGDTPESLPCVSRLAETLKERYMDLKSVSVDFNGVPNTFLDFLQINGTISSIKIQRGQGSLPGLDKLGEVCNLKKLHLFSTGLNSEELGALQHLKCLQYLKLAEDGHGLWDSEFHVKAGGFISLIWLCFEAPKLPPIKIDKGAMTVLASLQVLCPIGHVVTDISNLAKLNEVILHPSATDDEVAAWKEEAKKHINRPYVETQQQV